MKIALAQIRCRPGDVRSNVDAIVARIREAATRGAAVIVLPEMSDTGYHMPAIAKTASSWDGGPFAEISAVAAATRITVVVGLSERVEKDIYNTTAVIGPDGTLVAKYRKTHLITAEPVCEQNWIRPGDRAVLCDVAGFRAGLMTCYDIRVPELARKLVLAGAEILLVPAAFPLARIDHWKTLAAARAIENQVYVAAVNRVGVDEGLAFGGASRLLDPFGVLVAEASENEETSLIGDVSREQLLEVRSRLKVFADRRPEIY
jgi:predicted amidohydrolase